MTPIRPPLRLVRSVVVGATACGLGVTGHVLVGGSVHYGAVSVAVPVAVAVAWALAGHERDAWMIAALQIGLQLFVHAVLATGAAPATGGILPHELMLHAHVAAGLLTAVALRAGERRTWAAARRALARLASWCLRIIDRPAQRTDRPVLRPAPALRVVAHHRLLRHALVLRGPPVAT
jgi:hypothetical protein